MTQFDVMAYGTITTDKTNQALIESLGVSVGDYDDRAGFFYVRLKPEVTALLDEYRADFKYDLISHKEMDGDTVHDVDLLTTPQMKSERARLLWLVHSKRADSGNKDGFEWIELWRDLIARIDDHLSVLKPVRVNCAIPCEMSM